MGTRMTRITRIFADFFLSRKFYNSYRLSYSNKNSVTFIRNDKNQLKKPKILKSVKIRVIRVPIIRNVTK